MTTKNRPYSIPKFRNLEEEDKFWQSHSPLLEGAKGKVQKKKQNRRSFLSVRLTGDELSRLRERAAYYGLGPSTYARQILVQTMETGISSIPIDLIVNIFSLLTNKTEKDKEEYLRTLNSLYKTYLDMREQIAKDIIALGHPSIPNDWKVIKELLERQNVKK